MFNSEDLLRLEYFNDFACYNIIISEDGNFFIYFTFATRNLSTAGLVLPSEFLFLLFSILKREILISLGFNFSFKPFFFFFLLNDYMYLSVAYFILQIFRSSLSSFLQRDFNSWFNAENLLWLLFGFNFYSGRMPPSAFKFYSIYSSPKRVVAHKCKLRERCNFKRLKVEPSVLSRVSQCKREGSRVADDQTTHRELPSSKYPETQFVPLLLIRLVIAFICRRCKKKKNTRAPCFLSSFRRCTGRWLSSTLRLKPAFVEALRETTRPDSYGNCAAKVPPFLLSYAVPMVSP